MWPLCINGSLDPETRFAHQCGTVLLAISSDYPGSRERLRLGERESEGETRKHVSAVLPWEPFPKKDMGPEPRTCRNLREVLMGHLDCPRKQITNSLTQIKICPALSAKLIFRISGVY